MFNSPTKDATVTDLKNTAYEMGDDLHNAAHQAGRKVRSMYNTASNEISHAGDVVTSEIRNNPVRSSLIAMGVGVVLGALLRR